VITDKEIEKNIITTKLDLNKIPPLVGKNANMRAHELYKILKQTHLILYLIGDTGTGKSITGQNILKFVALEEKRPVYYLQMAPEDTKTSLIKGRMMINGSTLLVDGLLAKAAKLNACVFLDEITHSTESMLTMLNAFDGDSSYISSGDEVLNANGLTLLYGSNRTKYAGNIALPPSFANRIYGYPFEYPNLEEEIEISKNLSLREMKNGSPFLVPDSVLRYVCSILLESRALGLSLSSRNVAKVMVPLAVKTKLKEKKIDPYFSMSNNEPLQKLIYKRILDEKVQGSFSVSQLKHPDIDSFIQFVSSIGVNTFREMVKIGFDYYMDIAGSDYSTEDKKEKFAQSIL
jgi:hypothetical protein